jgi:hypothetical protein
MDVVEIFASPQYRLKLLKCVASFWSTILVRRQVSADYVWASVPIGPSWSPNLTEGRASGQISRRVDLSWGHDTLKVRVLAIGVIEVRGPAGGMATIAVGLSVHNEAA